jgi:hypothetical protein
MPKCKDCGTTYRNMDHSVYDCATAGGKDAQRMMGYSETMGSIGQEVADQIADEATAPAFVGTTNAF